MSKNCFFCGQKLSFFNSQEVDGLSICAECGNLWDSIKFATTEEELQKAETVLLSRATANPLESKYRIANVALLSLKELDAPTEELEKRERILKEEELRREEERRQEKEEKRRQEEKMADLARLEQEATDAFLKENGHEGYYEYRVLSLVDDNSGAIDINTIYKQLNDLGRQGWRLRCAFTNEIGKNSSSAGVGGFSSGTNATVDQNVLILERFIRFKS